jgi:hypothetical protein
MKITREKLRLWGACYNDERIATLVPEAGLTPLEVAALDIPTEDRLWVLLRESVIPARELRLLACGWAEDACRVAGWADERSLNAIAVARRFACGEVSAAELNAAGKASWAVSRAAESAAWSASREPEWAARAASRAAESAAWSASREPEWAAWAAESAACSAAWAAVQAACSAAWAEAAEQIAKAAEQLADVVKVLKQIDSDKANNI